MTPRTNIVLTDEDVDAFSRDGVLLIKGVLTAAEIHDLENAIEDIKQRVPESQTGHNVTAFVDNIDSFKAMRGQHPGGRQYDLDEILTALERSGDTILVDQAANAGARGSFLLDTTTWKRNAAIRKLALQSILPAIAADLLCTEKVNYYDDQVFIKEPNSVQRTAFHQDYGYFNVNGPQGCVFWIPADPVTPDSGAVSYVRGSHRWETVFKPNLFFAQTAFPHAVGERLPDIEGNKDDYDLVQFETQPGDVIVHHFLTVHGAGGNLHPTRQRRALSLRYCGETCTYFARPGAPPQPYHTHGLRDGDRLDSDQFPVVWPRPEQAGCFIGGLTD